MKTTEILNAIENKEKVSRWTVFRNRTEILNNIKDYSQETQDEVYFLIDSAKESL